MLDVKYLVIRNGGKSEELNSEKNLMVGGDSCICRNTALVVLVAAHPNVTSLSPERTPRVLHDPLVEAGSCIMIITNNCDTMVQLIPAIFAGVIIINTTTVKLERE